MDLTYITTKHANEVEAIANEHRELRVSEGEILVVARHGQVKLVPCQVRSVKHWQINFYEDVKRVQLRSLKDRHVQQKVSISIIFFAHLLRSESALSTKSVDISHLLRSGSARSTKSVDVCPLISCGSADSVEVNHRGLFTSIIVDSSL